MNFKMETRELPKGPRTDALCRGLWDSIRTDETVKPSSYEGGVFGVAGYEDINDSNFWYDMSHPAKPIARRFVADAACRFLGCDEDDLVPVFRGWSQVYDKGEYIIPHSHDQLGYTDVAVCLNIHGHGHIAFKDPDGSTVVVDTYPGLVVAFGGEVMHWSGPNEFDEPRIVIATNIYLKSNPYAEGWEVKYRHIL